MVVVWCVAVVPQMGITKTACVPAVSVWFSRWVQLGGCSGKGGVLLDTVEEGVVVVGVVVVGVPGGC